MDLQVPDWLIPKTTPWQQLAVGAQVGAHIAQARYRNQAMRIQVEEQAQREVLAMQALDLRREQQTTMNQLRLQQMEEEKAEAADLPLLQEYAKNPEAGPPAFKSPKSYARLAQIDLARQRSELGKQTAADMKDFYARLSKVGAEDRATVADMQKAGAPAAEVWSFLGQAEERQRAKLVTEKQTADATKPITPYQQAQLDAQKRRLEFDLEKFDKTHEVALKRLGYTEEQLKLQQDKFKAGKAFAPSEIKKLYNEAADAEAEGDYELADVLQERAKTLARGGRERSIQNQRVETMQSFKMKLLPKLRADPMNKKKTNEQLDAEAEELFNLANAGATPIAQPAPATNAPAAPTPTNAPPARPTFSIENSTPAQVDDVIRQANEAIKAGKDPAAVKARLKEMGIEIKE